MKSLGTVSKDDRPLKYMRQLDGLRAFAVLAVVWTHYLPNNYWPLGIYWGIIGVKLFFVLSGFLITRILFKCRQYVTSGNQTSLFTIRQFYIRRFLRIFPLYYATLALTALVDIPPVRETIVWHIPYLSNIYFAIIRGDWQGSVSHFWSLAVEEQFYLLWPWVILFSPKKLLAPTIFFLILSGAFFRLAATVFGLNQIAIWTLMPSCLDTLGLGSLLAYLTYRQETFNLSKEKIIKAFLIIGIPLYFLIEVLKGIEGNMMVVSFLGDIGLGLIFTWLVDRTARGFKGIIGQTLEFKPIVYVGKISYGIYVIHNFMPHIVNKAFHVFGISDYRPITVVLFSTVGTIVVATISWRFLESPINDIKRFFPYTHEGPTSMR